MNQITYLAAFSCLSLMLSAQEPSHTTQVNKVAASVSKQGIGGFLPFIEKADPDLLVQELLKPYSKSILNWNDVLASDKRTQAQIVIFLLASQTLWKPSAPFSDVDAAEWENEVDRGRLASSVWGLANLLSDGKKSYPGYANLETRKVLSIAIQAVYKVDPENRTKR